MKIKITGLPYRSPAAGVKHIFIKLLRIGTSVFMKA